MAAEMAAKLVASSTTKLIIGHLSRENNTPATAEKCTEDHLHSKGMHRNKDYIPETAPVMTQGRYIVI